MFKHYILTRFNLGIYDNDNPYKKWVGDPDEWLENRLWLFEKYTFPAMRQQTNQNFTWVLAFDEQTPTDILVKYDYCDNIQVVYEQPHLWLRTVEREAEWLITSRIDNDDYYMPEFVETIQREFREEDEVIDVEYYALNTMTEKYYTSNRFRPNSPFVSLVERWEDCKTVMHRPHTYMPDEHKARKIKDVLAIQVIHDNNVSNKICGRPI